VRLGERKKNKKDKEEATTRNEPRIGKDQE
jgi:hypothetical protein